MENDTGKKSPSYSFSVDERFSEGLKFPKPNHLKKDIARASGQLGYSPAVTLHEDSSFPTAPNSTLPSPFASPLSWISELPYSDSKRCYLPNTLPSRPGWFFLLFNSPDPVPPFQALLPGLIALKLTLGPQTPELIFWSVGWNKAVNHCRLCSSLLSANRSLPF